MISVETELKGKNLLFIAGGIGLAPLRSVINYVLDNRENYGTVDILYGSRSADDLVQLKEIQEVWMKTEGVNVYLTIDREQEGWDGHVGFVPNYLKEVGFTTDKTALVCGPPIYTGYADPPGGSHHGYPPGDTGCEDLPRKRAGGRKAF